MSAEIITIPHLFQICELSDLSGKTYRKKFAYLILKRVVDLVVATALLLIVSPLVLVIAVLIRLESEGPAIFTQERVGATFRRKDGRIVWEIRLFRCYKLRTMRKDSDPEIHRKYLLQFRNGHIETGPKSAPFKIARDPRITRTGRWLRRASLDELPQLLNVIKGDMSLVGPRPVPVYEVELYEDRHYDRLAARPGITGLWQVYGRSRVSFEEMIQMDVDYARQCSLWFDIKLLLLTINSVVSLKGAA